jgi:hypothetical protein
MLESSLRFAPPPRRVPFSLAISTSLNAVVQVGFAVLGFSSIFFWTFVANADFSFITFAGSLGRASGVVTRVETTNASENRTSIRANHYEYSVGGQNFQGVSYSTGEAVQQGENVLVEYLQRAPGTSRIAGQRRKMFGPLVLLVIIFPALGLAFIIGGVRWGSRRARLMRDGIFTTGVLKRKRATNATVNNRRVFDLFFEFTARDGRRCEAKARTSIPERLEDEREEPLLYNPERPEDAVMLDEAPARPQFDERGELMGRPVAALLAMILPAIIIAANVLVLLSKLG